MDGFSCCLLERIALYEAICYVAVRRKLHRVVAFEKKLRLLQAVEAFAHTDRVEGRQLFRTKLNAHLVSINIGVGNSSVQRRLEPRARRVSIHDKVEVDGPESRKASLDGNGGKCV